MEIMIVLITPTGGRPAQINLCAHFMKRQTYTGKVTWIIVDDCNPRTTDNIQNDKENWNIIKVYPNPPWGQGQNTQGRNIAEGINTMLSNYKQEEIEGIFIIEDDDYYKPFYLERMTPRFSGYQAIGEKNTVYYNVYFRTSFTHINTGHSSLFQTAFTMESLSKFEDCLNQKFIDMAFWTGLSRVNLFNDGNLSIGIKGMPGRYGIGSGHTRLRNMPSDYNWEYLTQLIGKEDAALYTRYFRGGSQQQSIFNKRSF
jgi:hypothetical protein